MADRQEYTEDTEYFVRREKIKERNPVRKSLRVFSVFRG
jgi:hypothetical protein